MRTIGGVDGYRQETTSVVFRPSTHQPTWTGFGRPYAVRARGRAVSERLRRQLNVAVAAFLLLITMPLFALIAVLIKLTSRGPVFYTQRRVGMNRRATEDGPTNHRRRVDYGGRLFRIYKFRTMHVADDAARQVWARPDDPRITRLGRVLRKTRLDELPQLVNVLKGDMNLVGPRPEQPEISLDLREQIDRYAERHQVLPGITGWAQVNQRYDMTMDDVRRKVRLDLEYIERRSPFEDLKIVARTVPVVLFQRGGF